MDDSRKVARTCGLRPGAPLRGELRVPGSKSIAQRLLVCGMLAEGASDVRGLPEGDDVRHAERLAADFRAGAAVLHVGESGTLARLAAAAVAFHGRADGVRLEGEGSLRRRSSPALLAALEGAGVGVKAGPWPLHLAPAVPPARVELRGPSSSQEVSGLLIALAASGEAHELDVRGVIPSRPYVDLTVSVLARFGATVTAAKGTEGERFGVRGPLRVPSAGVEVEPDASLAAVGLAAACMTGGEVSVPGLSQDSAQGDVRASEHLSRFGDPLQRGARLDLAGEPDLAPVLAAVAAAVPEETHLSGLGTLPGKESSRIEVLVRGLTAAGCAAHGTAEALTITGPRTWPRERVVLDPAGDHRMAFAFALLGLLREGVDVAGPECVGKSWPSFWEDLEHLGARVVREG
jgi:3-phosphoshikimate 1-carboxyvinyltransferase